MNMDSSRSSSYQANEYPCSKILVSPDIEEQWKRVMRPYKKDALRCIAECGLPDESDEQREVTKARFASLLEKFLAENP